MSEIKYRAVKYIRLSRADDKPGESDSVINQEKLIDEWLKTHPEIEVVSTKIDDGWSGLLFDRPAFKEMMDDITSGTVNCCITKDLSRLGREHVETGRYLRRIFPAYGVRFIAITDNIDTLKDSPDDLSTNLRNLINDAYCRDISQKTRSSLDVKRANGEYVGACCIYGYMKSEENRHMLEPDSYAAGIVREIFRMKLDGMAAARIAGKLNSRGILSPYQYKKEHGLPHPKNGFADKADAKWSAQTIIRILQDETYTGTLVQGKQGTQNYKLKVLLNRPKSEWYLSENAHEPIVSKNDFDLVQRLMQLDTRTPPDGTKVNVFSGLLICGCCGNRMIRKSAPGNGKRYYNYWCPTTKKGGCTDSVMVKESELMDCVLKVIKAHIANVASLEALIANTNADKIGRSIAASLTEQLCDNERRLDKIREFKAGLHENMIAGNLSKEEFKSLKAKYAEDADLLILANRRLRQEIDDALSCRHERLAWMRCLTEYADLDSIDRKTVATLVKCIRIVGKREIEIEFNYKAEYESALALVNETVNPERNCEESAENAELNNAAVESVCAGSDQNDITGNEMEAA